MSRHDKRYRSEAISPYMVVYGHIRQVGGYMVYIYLNILEFTIFLGIFGMLVEVGT